MFILLLLLWPVFHLSIFIVLLIILWIFYWKSASPHKMTCKYYVSDIFLANYFYQKKKNENIQTFAHESKQWKTYDNAESFEVLLVSNAPNTQNTYCKENYWKLFGKTYSAIFFTLRLFFVFLFKNILFTNCLYFGVILIGFCSFSIVLCSIVEAFDHINAARTCRKILVKSFHVKGLQRNSLETWASISLTKREWKQGDRSCRE